MSAVVGILMLVRTYVTVYYMLVSVRRCMCRLCTYVCLSVYQRVRMGLSHGVCLCIRAHQFVCVFVYEGMGAGAFFYIFP